MKFFSSLIMLFITTVMFSQVGHIMQGVGAINMSMGGAATAQPLDISGAMQWNPATLSTFEGSVLKFDIGMFKGTPTLYSSMGPLSGAADSELGNSPMPALAFAWGKEESKHKFGVSMFGISGFGVDFPADMNYPQDAMGNPNLNYDPTKSSNPILFPQMARGFGNLNSNYMLLQVGFTWAYEVSDKFTVGVQPTVNYASLTLEPNPIASPDPMLGYPISDATPSYGFGAQIGVFYDTQKGLKFGASYKTTQSMSEMEFDSNYLDGSSAPSPTFSMDYPSIFSLGLGYSKGNIDLAVDYRYIDYENTEGFEASGWTPTFSVSGFGWNSVNVLSAGIQYKGINKLPLRIGYTYSSNPIEDELAFFSTPATAVIANAFQAGLSFELNESFKIDGVYHYGTSNGKTTGQLLNPQMIAPNNPLGKIPGSEVSYDMKTSMFQIGVSYIFGQKSKEE